MLRKLNKPSRGFTLIEIMIVVAIIALLAAIAVPNFLRARKRSQATHVLEDLRVIDAAIDQYAIENNKSTDNTVTWTDVQKYLKQGSVLYNSGGRDLLGNQYGGNPARPSTNYGVFTVDGNSNVALNKTTYGQLSDVAPSDFWSPFVLTP